MSDEHKKSKRGFAAMTPEMHRELSSRGGHTVQANGTAHRFTSESAKRAAAIAYATGKVHHWTAEEAKEASRKSHEARSAKKAAEVTT